MNSVTTCRRRITSTYVENTCHALIACYQNQDHLHIRGEYLQMSDDEYDDLGSPPHTWRIPIFYILVNKYCRITSTYVENTEFLSLAFSFNRDHLHIRGEYFELSKHCFLQQGSPPHTWRIRKLSSEN